MRSPKMCLCASGNRTGGSCLQLEPRVIEQGVSNRTLTTTITILPATTTTFTAPPPTTAALPITPLVVVCSGPPLYKPTTLRWCTPLCSNYVRNITWTSWTPNVAIGNGTLITNDCAHGTLTAQRLHGQSEQSAKRFVLHRQRNHSLWSVIYSNRYLGLTLAGRNPTMPMSIQRMIDWSAAPAPAVGFERRLCATLHWPASRSIGSLSRCSHATIGISLGDTL